MTTVSRSHFLALGAAFLISSLSAQADIARSPELGAANGAIRVHQQTTTPAILAVPVALLSVEANAAGVELSLRKEGVPGDVFLAGILVSFESSLSHYLTGLPPLLTNHAVLAAGFTTEQFVVQIDQKRMPKDMKLYAQGVVADSSGITTTAVSRIDGGLE